MAKALDLFHAYFENNLPQKNGLIITGNFDLESVNSNFEIIDYFDAKSIHFSKAGLTFHSDGRKKWLFVEPSCKQLSPQFPYKLNEMEILTTETQKRIIASKKPTLIYSAFTILKPSCTGFSFIFFKKENTIQILQNFLTQTLIREMKISSSIAEKAVRIITTP